MSYSELIFLSPNGVTIHKYKLSVGKREFMRFISSYLDNCKFYKNIDDAAKNLENERLNLNLL